MIPVLTGIIGGMVCGTISGITPGIHANMIAAFLLGFSPIILPYLGPEGMAAILIATLITHSFLEIIPATFLGVPDDGTALSVLPAHSLTMDGKGEEAVRISALGCLWGVIFAIPLALGALWFIPLLQTPIDILTGSLLILIMGIVIVRSESTGWLCALFLVSGLLGMFAFRFDYLSWNTLGAGNILMPLLTGLFGLPFLLTASEGRIPRQHYSGMEISTHTIIRSTLPGTFAGLVVGWLPGLSTASANTWYLDSFPMMRGEEII
jgi:putative membrane protein